LLRKDSFVQTTSINHIDWAVNEYLNGINSKDRMKREQERKKELARVYARIFNTRVGKNKIYFLGNPGLTSPSMN
jgi:hypothetical protein